MIQLHLSKEWFASVVREIDPREPTPICGARDGIATLRRGRGEGLVGPAAWSPEFHCPDCYRLLLRDPTASEGR